MKKIILTLCITAAILLPSSFALAASPADAYNQIFGSPEDFVTDFEDGVKKNLNEYMGVLVSSAGFILVIRAVVK